MLWGRGIRGMAAILVLAVGLLGCGPASLPCGTFAFVGTPQTNQGINATVTFTFNPATCSAPATTSTTIAYIQIVRVIDFPTGAFLAPSSEQQNRIVTGQTQVSLNGWAVDRVDNRVWGYYARNNDGTFAPYLTTGSNTSNAILGDGPGGWPNQTWFDAVSVPVCLVGVASCQDRLLGFYYWQFFVDSSGVVGNPLNFVARVWHADAVDLSVVEWNADAPGLGKNTFPALSRMP